jgi:hypothetical protein
MTAKRTAPPRSPFPSLELIGNNAKRSEVVDDVIAEHARIAAADPLPRSEVAEIIGEYLFVTTAKGGSLADKRSAYVQIAAYAIQAAMAIPTTGEKK